MNALDPDNLRLTHAETHPSTGKAKQDQDALARLEDPLSGGNQRGDGGNVDECSGRRR